MSKDGARFTKIFKVTGRWGTLEGLSKEEVRELLEGMDFYVFNGDSECKGLEKVKK